MSTAVIETLELPKFSIGVGDRFAHQAKAQLAACMKAADAGVEVVPVWNKSNREHSIIGTEPVQTRAAADAAVKEMGWKKPYFLDADHINLKTVQRFLDPCDFFTIDVAEAIGQPLPAGEVDAFLSAHPELSGRVRVPGKSVQYQDCVRLGGVQLAVRFVGHVHRRKCRAVIERQGIEAQGVRRDNHAGEFSS